MSGTIVWFRRDLRLQDNPALAVAVTRGGFVVPLFILDDAGEGRWRAGAASRWWLHHSLAQLDESLGKRGSQLLLAAGRRGVRTAPGRPLPAKRVVCKIGAHEAARAAAMAAFQSRRRRRARWVVWRGEGRRGQTTLRKPRFGSG